jgi:hypothetical protein
VSDVTHASGLQNLAVGTAARLATPPPNTSGASRISVLVRGAGSAFRLEGVRLLAAAADHGGAASPGTPGAIATCDVRPICADGAPGATAGDGADATTPGTFSAMGFTPSDGTAQTAPGRDGNHGLRGTDAVRTDCNTGCGCGACITVHDATVIAPGGGCGCAGEGGTSGMAGRGGGASVALLVAGKNAAVDIRYSLLTAGDGGNGSAGGSGGLGSAGTPGGTGSQARCHLSDCVGGCGSIPPSCAYGDVGALMTGTEGSAGGKGGNGGKGGGGAGGPAYAVVTLGGARAVLDAVSQLTHGTGGLGAGTAPAGSSGKTADFP